MSLHNEKLTRSKTDRIIAGVCGGLGAYYKIRSVFFRLGFVFLAFFDGGMSMILYLIAAILIPSAKWGEGGSSVDGVRGFVRDVQYEVQHAADKLRSGGKVFDFQNDKVRIILFAILGLLIIGFMSPYHYWYAYRFVDLLITTIIIVILLIIIKK